LVLLAPTTQHLLALAVAYLATPTTTTQAQLQPSLSEQLPLLVAEAMITSQAAAVSLVVALVVTVCSVSKPATKLQRASHHCSVV